jgi:hypothetical protein
MSVNSAPTLASKSPRSLVTSVSFWIRHLALAVLVVGLFLLLKELWPLAAGSLTSPLKRLLCWGIVGLCVIAAFDAAHTLAILDVNRALAQYIITNGEALLRALRANPADRPELESLTSFLPQNPSRPAMVRMFEHVLDEARDREFGSSATLVQVYREGVLTRYQRIDRLQQLALRLGILGTFIGLAEALHVVPAGLKALLPGQAQVSSVTATRQDVIINMGEELIKFLADAFGTSIVGLATACGIWGMTFVVRRELTTYFDAMERSADVSLALARNAVNESDFQEAFERLIHRLDELKRHLFDRVAKLGESVEALQGRVDAQTETMADAVVALHEGATSLDSVMRTLSGRQDELAKHFEALLAKAGFDKLFTRIEGAVQRAGESVGKDLTRDLASISQSLNDVRTSLTSGTASALPFPHAAPAPRTPPPMRRQDTGFNITATPAPSLPSSIPAPDFGGVAVASSRRAPPGWTLIFGTVVLGTLLLFATWWARQ